MSAGAGRCICRRADSLHAAFHRLQVDAFPISHRPLKPPALPSARRPSSLPVLLGGLAAAAALGGGCYWAATHAATQPALAAAKQYLAGSVLAKSGFFAAFRCAALGPLGALRWTCCRGRDGAAGRDARCISQAPALDPENRTPPDASPPSPNSPPLPPTASSS